MRDRLSFMRSLGLSLGDHAPDAKTIWLFREQLVRAGAMDKLFERFDAALHDAGYLAMGGQIIDATGVAAPRQKLIDDEKAVVRSAAAHDSRPFEGLLDPKNTASKVWADAAYRSARNEAAMAKRGRISMVHYRKPKGRPLPASHAKANAARSAVHSAVEHVFPGQKTE